MKEFFENGKHGYTWVPDNLESAINAVNLAFKSRDRLVSECRQNSLKHSWSSAGNQIDKMYIDIYNDKNSETNGIMSIVSLPFRFVFFLAQWFFLMMLTAIFLLPFITVSKPKDSTTSAKSSSPTKEKNELHRAKDHTCVYSFIKNQFDDWSNTTVPSKLFIAILAIAIVFFYCV